MDQVLCNDKGGWKRADS